MSWAGRTAKDDELRAADSFLRAAGGCGESETLWRIVAVEV